MSDDALKALAEAAGLAPRWKDYRGESHEVAPDTLRSVLAALDLPAGTDDDVRDSTARLHAPDEAIASLLTLPVGEAMRLPVPGALRIVLEDGTVIEGKDEIPPIGQAGYHRLEFADTGVTLAVVPRSCVAVPPGRPWGIAVQLYSLRRAGDGGIGDFSALTQFVNAAARHGADAVAISPVHAQFSADPDRFSPYAPSSRIMLNVFHADAPEPNVALEASDLVNWPAAARLRLQQFRAMFDSGALRHEFDAFRASSGEPLEAHARFETLHGHFYGADPQRWHWRSWPEPFRNPASPDVAAFAAEHANEVAFHAYLQFLADRGLSAAPPSARIIVIDDATPEPALAAWLSRLAATGAITLLRHTRNQGFPAAVNTGLAAAPGHDILLLNSDTLVPPGAIAALHQAAYADPATGSVTPFSNQATILSYPDRAGGNAIPSLAAATALHRHAAAANGTLTVEIPTGIGFCMLLRHDCLAATGPLRAGIFAQGYGEENDWCLRARHLGYRHMAATGVYVAHRGGVSFGAAGQALNLRNATLLNRLHPGYDVLIAAFNATDPLAAARAALDAERLRAAARAPHADPNARNGVLLISHQHGGGVARRLQTDIASRRARGQRPLLLIPAAPDDPATPFPWAAQLGETATSHPNLRFKMPRR